MIVTSLVTHKFLKIRVCKALKVTPPGDHFTTSGLTVHAVSFVHGRGPVFYASLPCGPCAAETLKGCGTNGAGDKHRLVSILWDHLVAMESPLWKGCQSSN